VGGPAAPRSPVPPAPEACPGLWTAPCGAHQTLCSGQLVSFRTAPRSGPTPSRAHPGEQRARRVEHPGHPRPACPNEATAKAAACVDQRPNLLDSALLAAALAPSAAGLLAAVDLPAAAAADPRILLHLVGTDAGLCNLGALLHPLIDQPPGTANLDRLVAVVVRLGPDGLELQPHLVAALELATSLLPRSTAPAPGCLSFSMTGGRLTAYACSEAAAGRGTP
jgi:hypothetical protein